MKQVNNQVNNRYKLFGIIHVGEILWVVLITALVFGAIQFSVPRRVDATVGGTGTTGGPVVRYTIELGERRDQNNTRRVPQSGFHENVQIGEHIFDAMRGIHIGTIVDVYAMPFTVEAFDEANNIIRQAPVPGLEFVYIVVEANVQITDYEMLVGLFPVSVGRSAYVRSKYFAGSGYIVSLEIIN